MMRGMYAAIAGLKAHQTMLDVTANNLANVDTIGYKAQRTTFVDELSQVIRGASGATNINGGTNPMEVGLGVQVGSIDNLMGQGSAQSTGNPLDIAMQSTGWFRVAQGAPPTVPTAPEYTRAGNFTTNTLGYLTTQEGLYVIGRNAVLAGGAYKPGPNDTYVKIPPGSTDIAVGQDGAVTYVDQNSTSSTYQQRVTAAYLSLASFPNESGLERIGGSLWTETANSGLPTVGTPNSSGFGTAVSGELEMSNVDLATEFTNMITAQRGFQANSKAITTADEMLQTLVNMKQ